MNEGNYAYVEREQYRGKGHPFARHSSYLHKLLILYRLPRFLLRQPPTPPEVLEKYIDTWWWKLSNRRIEVAKRSQ